MASTASSASSGVLAGAAVASKRLRITSTLPDDVESNTRQLHARATLQPDAIASAMRMRQSALLNRKVNFDASLADPTSLPLLVSVNSWRRGGGRTNRTRDPFGFDRWGSSFGPPFSPFQAFPIDPDALLRPTPPSNPPRPSLPPRRSELILILYRYR